MSVLHAAQKTANKHLKNPHRYPVNPDRASIRLFFRRLLELGHLLGALLKEGA